MLLPLVQQGVSPVLQAGRPVSHEYLGTRPQAMSEAATTPSGWKVDSQASRMRRFVGRNSRVMVASMGMLPGRGQARHHQRGSDRVHRLGLLTADTETDHRGLQRVRELVSSPAMRKKWTESRRTRKQMAP